MSLIVLAITIVAVGLLGAGIVGFMGAKQKSYPFPVNSFKALQIANAGVETAIMCSSDGTCNLSSGTLGPISFGGGSFSASLASDILTSTGTFNNVSRVVTLSNFAEYVAHITDWTDEWVISQSQGDAIILSEGGTVADLGQIGDPYRYRFGVLVYGGNNPAGNCVDGECDFRGGFRAYFVFKFADASAADGFTFLFMNAVDNDKNSVGGDSAMGEMMAYAGDARAYITTDGSYGQGTAQSGRVDRFLDGKGVGLRPPKVGIEFDTYYNGCNDLCTSQALRNDTSRCDPSNTDHMAYVFWGNTSGTLMYCKERQYLKWQPSISYPLLSIVFPTTDNGYLYRVTIADTAGTTQPTWPTTKGGTVTRDGVQYKECTWRASTRYSLNEIVVPTIPNGYYYQCSRLWGSGVNRGRTGSSEPTWPTAVGDTVRDNNAQWTNAGNITFPGYSPSYDDNRHGAGSGSTINKTTNNPTANPPDINFFDNSAGTMPNGTTWLINTTYAYRMEVTRTTNGDSTGTYRIKSWLKQCTDGTTNCDVYTNSNFGNTSLDYTTDTNDPYLDRTITLNSTDHLTKFNKFLFGFSEATGAATQNAKIRKFRLNFKQ